MGDEITMEQLLAAHHQATKDQLQDIKYHVMRIEDKLDKHRHGENVSWMGLMPILLAIAGAVLVVG